VAKSGKATAKPTIEPEFGFVVGDRQCLDAAHATNNLTRLSPATSPATPTATDPTA